MLTHYPAVTDYDGLIKLHKYEDKEDASDKGAFSFSCTPVFCLRVSRRLGVCKVKLKIARDSDGFVFEKAMRFTNSALGVDEYTEKLDLHELCADFQNGLFFYRFEFVLDERLSLWSTTYNNSDVLAVSNEQDSKAFRLLVYKDGFSTPDWAKNVVMYHIFVDRFNKGSTPVPKRNDARLIEDWENGVPEYPKNNGDALDNNTFFGGTLYGITEKLGYLKSLGIGCIYLSPVFKAYSNHKYDTGDYETIDEMFGGEKAFDELLGKAKELGIHVLLDGVFNHTGDDSKYFNKYGKYDSVGAYQSYDSPYHGWYSFRSFPDDYDCWWGIKILPKLNNTVRETREYFLGENGVVRSRIKEGTSGWRLDVADELPQDFLEELRSAVKAQDPDALIIGEVWENAADKVAYSERRRYFRGCQLDSVMNYPVKNAIIDFIKCGDAKLFYDRVTDIYSSYPEECSNVLMNPLGTHDTERILTVLGGQSSEGKSNETLAYLKMNGEERHTAVKLLKCASVLQFTLPGMPSVFYGDEAGIEGYHDPFCRRPFPWNSIDSELLSHYKRLCSIKNEFSALHDGKLIFLRHDNAICIFRRISGESELLIAVNSWDNDESDVFDAEYTELMTGDEYDSESVLPAHTALILKKSESTEAYSND